MCDGDAQDLPPSGTRRGPIDPMLRSARRARLEAWAAHPSRRPLRGLLRMRAGECVGSGPGRRDACCNDLGLIELSSDGFVLPKSSSCSVGFVGKVGRHGHSKSAEGFGPIGAIGTIGTLKRSKVATAGRRARCLQLRLTHRYPPRLLGKFAARR